MNKNLFLVLNGQLSIMCFILNESNVVPLISKNPGWSSVRGWMARDD